MVEESCEPTYNWGGGLAVLEATTGGGRGEPLGGELPTNRFCGLVLTLVRSGRLAPTKIPFKKPGSTNPLTIRGMNHQAANPGSDVYSLSLSLSIYIYMYIYIYI